MTGPQKGWSYNIGTTVLPVFIHKVTKPSHKLNHKLMQTRNQDPNDPTLYIVSTLSSKKANETAVQIWSQISIDKNTCL